MKIIKNLTSVAENENVEPVKMEDKMNNEMKVPFIHRVELRGMDNGQLMEIVQRAVESRKVLRMLVTPGVDKNGRPYYWMGLRYDRNEIVFKLLVNDEISSYIMAFLNGEDEMPEVKSCEPDMVNDNYEEWLIFHRCKLASKANAKTEEMVSSKGRIFLNTKLSFKNGKISYSEEFTDVLSFLKPDEQ